MAAVLGPACPMLRTAGVASCSKRVEQTCPLMHARRQHNLCRGRRSTPTHQSDFAGAVNCGWPATAAPLRLRLLSEGAGQQRQVSCASDATFGQAQPSQSPLAGWLQRLAYHREIIVRALITLTMLVVIRSGHFIPIPGIDLAQLPVFEARTEGERLIRALYGQARDIPASVFDLGISPYINASIIVSVLMVLPAELTSLPGVGWLARLKEARKEGRSGEAHINGTINALALAFAAVAALLRTLELQPSALFSGGPFVAQTALALVAGSCIIHYCANTISHYGLGNGSSLVISAGIITEYAGTLHTVLSALDTGVLSVARLASMLVGYLALVLLAVMLATSELRLPVVQYASSASGSAAAARGGGADGKPGTGSMDLFAQARLLTQKKAAERSAKSDYFPLQLNGSGMMSIVIGGAAFFGFLPKLLGWTGCGAAAAWLVSVQPSLGGLLLYGLIVFALEFLPLGGVNPKEMAEYFNLMSVGLKGVVPGEPTERELRTKLLQCKAWGGLALAVLAVGAQLFDQACLRVLGTTLATTSLLIIVGAVLQTARQVESLLEGPKLQQRLDQEQRLIGSLSQL